MRLLLLFLLPLSACGGDAPAPSPSAVLVRLADDDARGLDPQQVSDIASLRVAADQFEGLTRYKADGTIEPGLAHSWECSADGLRWTFQLRPNLRFSDGVPIRASTFVAVLDRLRAPTTASPNAELFTLVEKAVALDDGTLRIDLRRPFPVLPELLAHPAAAALPIHRIEALGPRWTSERPLVVSGAYQLTEWALNDHITLATNRRWHEGRPAISSVEWRPVTDKLTQLRLFRAGAADVTSDIPATRLPWLQKHLPHAIHIAPYRGAFYFAFNTRKPPFDDVRVRRALNLATERRWIADKIIGTGTLPAWGIIPPGIDGLSAYQPAWAGWTRSRRLAAAQSLLRSAGYGPDRPLRFEIRFNSDSDHRRVAVALAAMWRPLGVEAQLLNSEASLHFASLRRGEFELGRSGWIGDVSAAENFLSVHRASAGAVNYSGYANSRYDAAVDDAMREALPAKRATAMRRAEHMLMQDAPIIPIYFYVSRALVSPRIAGWRNNLANVHPTRSLRLHTP
jgi:oligopeptide transport system substrate-binding protein